MSLSFQGEWKAETRMIMVPAEARPKKKLVRLYLNRKKKLSVMVHAFHPSNHRKRKIGGLQSKSA
jgi:hypothetical protein